MKNGSGMIVHHIKPRELFQNITNDINKMADDKSNLITLCHSCHQKIHLGMIPKFLILD